MRTRLLAIAGLIGLVVAPLAAAPSAGAGPVKPGKPLTVMTRNIYLGADINRPVNAAAITQAQGGSPQEILVALANATHVTRTNVDRTDFPTRAGLLADEVAEHRPDLIGLQEVALWRSGPVPELDKVGVPNATTVDYDYLEILLDALTARGLAYEAVAVGERADVEAPSFTGSPFAGTMANARDVRMTMRDVILMRSDKGLQVTASGDQIFEHNLVVPIAGVVMRFDRGYHWVDVRAGATSLRFVNSHFEAFSSDIALAQASEVLADAPSAEDATVFVCDCNSDPLDDHVKTGIGDTQPHKAPYDLITGPGGFTDQWLEWAPAEAGWTSGLSELVKDTSAAGFDHRIDMVFARTPHGVLAVDRGAVTGTDLTDRDPATGLWPSDHGGVVLRLRGF